jgi:hypothetical protein
VSVDPEDTQAYCADSLRRKATQPGNGFARMRPTLRSDPTPTPPAWAAALTRQ